TTSGPASEPRPASSVPATNRAPRRRSNARSFRPGLFGLGFGLGLFCCGLGLVGCGLELCCGLLVGDGLWLRLLLELVGADGVCFRFDSVFGALCDSIGRG